MSNNKPSLLRDFKFLPRKDTRQILLSCEGLINDFRASLITTPELIPVVASNLDLCTTRDKFHRLGINLSAWGISVSSIKQTEFLLNQLLIAPLTDNEYQILRGRLVEVLVEAIVFPNFNNGNCGTDSHVVYKGRIIVYPPDAKGPEVVQTIDIYALDVTRAIFIECKARPQRFTEHNIQYLSIINSIMRHYTSVRSFIKGITLLTPRQLEILRLQPAYKPWIESINVMLDVFKKNVGGSPKNREQFGK